MKHTKTEVRTAHHVITLTNAEITAALMTYARETLKLTGETRNVEPPYFQATSEPRSPHGAQMHLAGPLASGNSCVQLVFDTVIQSEVVSA